MLGTLTTLSRGYEDYDDLWNVQCQKPQTSAVKVVCGDVRTMLFHLMSKLMNLVTSGRVVTQSLDLYRQVNYLRLLNVKMLVVPTFGIL